LPIRRQTIRWWITCLRVQTAIRCWVVCPKTDNPMMIRSSVKTDESSERLDCTYTRSSLHASEVRSLH